MARVLDKRLHDQNNKFRTSCDIDASASQCAFGTGRLYGDVQRLSFAWMICLKIVLKPLATCGDSPYTPANGRGVRNARPDFVRLKREEGMR